MSPMSPASERGSAVIDPRAWAAVRNLARAPARVNRVVVPVQVVLELDHVRNTSIRFCLVARRPVLWSSRSPTTREKKNDPSCRITRSARHKNLTCAGLVATNIWAADTLGLSAMAPDLGFLPCAAIRWRPFSKFSRSFRPSWNRAGF